MASVLGYMRRDNDSAVQRREMWTLIKDYAASIGLEKFNDSIYDDGCDLLAPLDQRPAFKAVRQLLRPGDTLIIPFVGTIAGHPRSFEKFMRWCLSSDVRVYCLETRSDLTASLGAVAPFLKIYGFWESRVIELSEKAKEMDAFYEDALKEVATVAVDNAIAALKRTDIVPALSDAIRMGTAQAAAYAHERRGPTYREVMSKRAIEHAEKNGKAAILDKPVPNGAARRDVGHDGSAAARGQRS